ncbi:hypothetical protein O181_062993 [Austropuccinia psidii MF-1]|uniref:Uncharacterized protein n=1 Tax=Austropuccinia psidii MF-1 TaxID=1389203 RepID=A0A9Q3EKK5_9BASI|nr:hypothetical protein [Austropuccinia psidii MF-1]
MRTHSWDEKHSKSFTRPQKQIHQPTSSLSSGNLRSPRNSVNSSRSLPNQPHSKSLTASTSSQSQWVTFPPLPGSTSNPFSSAVQFVSTTLRPLTEPSIAYASPTLSNQLKNNLSSSCRSSKESIHYLVAPLSQSVNGLKRSRTTASSSSAPLSRKRSKSDFDSMSYRSSQSLPIARPTSMSASTSASSASRPKAFGSSTSLAQMDSSRSTSRQFYASYLDTPASSLRYKQLASCESSRQTSSTSLTRSGYTSGSIKSATSVRSIHSLHPPKSRVQSPLRLTTTSMQPENSQVVPIRPTYLGGVGVYLNHHHDDQDENQTPRGTRLNHKPKPNLSIDLDLCNEPQTERSKGVGKWCNRLLLSPLSSASYSVYSFFTSTSSTSSSVDVAQELEENKTITEIGSETQEQQFTAGIPRRDMSKKLPFRNWDLN